MFCVLIVFFKKEEVRKWWRCYKLLGKLWEVHYLQTHQVIFIEQVRFGRMLLKSGANIVGG